MAASAAGTMPKRLHPKAHHAHMHAHARTTQQVCNIIGSFGTLRAFSLLRDAGGNPTGTALAEFSDPAMVAGATAGLSAMMVGDTRLQVAHAASADHILALQQLIQQQHEAMLVRLTGKALPAAGTGGGGQAEAAQQPSQPSQHLQQQQQQQQAPPQPALCLVRVAHMVCRADLLAEVDYEGILQETRAEVAKYGALKQVGFVGVGVGGLQTRGCA
jgi:hypothetical protein